MMRHLTILISFIIFCIPFSVTEAQFNSIGFNEFNTEKTPIRIKAMNALFGAAPEFASTRALSPSLVITGNEGNAKPLELVECSYSVRIVRFLIEVTITYEFYNPTNERVEGVFTFPLPDGATVDGYALDINDEMVDGVAVPKKQATVIFNEIEKRGIDPGLVEWSGKNAFKSRIFPIFSHQSRTIKIRYTDLIDGSKYTVPIKFDGKIETFSIKIDASKTDVLPKIIGNELPELKFDETTRLAETISKKFQPNENLLLEFPPNTSQQTVSFTAPECNYFVTRIPTDEIQKHLEPKRLEIEKKLAQPNRIAVYWDASGSRFNGDHTKELELLRQYLETKKCSVDLIVFRDKPEPVRSFDAASYEKLFDTLKSVSYDGGTNFLSILSYGIRTDLSLLFSDGNYNCRTNISENSVVLQSPVYVIGTGNSHHSPALQFVTKSSGGTLFHLMRDNVATILEGIGKIALTAYALSDKSENQASWRILKDSFVVAHFQNQNTLNFRAVIGFGDMPETIPISVSGDVPVCEDSLVERIWAQLRLQQLLFSQHTTHEKECRRNILELGLKYNIVTPETTLLVLESVHQYLEFMVEPPASQPVMLEEYREKKTQWKDHVQKVKKERQNTGVRRLRRSWNIFMRWWDHSFELPDGYKFVPQYTNMTEAFASPSNRSSRYSGIAFGMGGMGGGFGGGGMSDANTQDSPAAMIPDIVLQPRIDDSPYLEIIRNAAVSSKQSAYRVYLEQRKLYQNSPAFYWESATLFHELGDTETALRILSNLQELDFGDDLVTLRMMGFLMLHWNQIDLAVLRFREALELDEADPNTLRGLALSFLLRENLKQDHLIQSLESFHKFFKTVWNYYDYQNDYTILCLVTLYEQYRTIIKGKTLGFRTSDNNQDNAKNQNVDKDQNNAKLMDVDLRIVALASHPNVDVCLAVTEPCGEFVRQNNRCLSVHGGTLITNNEDLSQYLIRKAEKGTYKIILERFDVKENDEDEWDDLENEWEDLKDILYWTSMYYNEEKSGSNNDEKEKKKADALAPGVVFVDIFTNYGRADETRRSLCITLNDETETYEIGEVHF
ncbi:MAG: hypothetical protein LBC20_06425 [Planctomycetaceae bacterium]|jgi:tetratricopeptide (TPR) repeat protein|nr:hypothetical protein [Planctomycetaceae bacterium]